MDIIDIMLARAMTPQGKTDTYVAKANAAAAKAEKAEQDAAAAIAIVNNAAEDISAAQEAAASLLADTQEALNSLNAAIAAIGESGSLDTAAVDAEVKKLVLSISNNNTNTMVSKNIVTTYPDNTTRTLSGVVKYYKTIGNNEDGTMTQKAITAALSAIPSGGSSGDSGSNINIDSDAAGQLVIIDENGNIVASGIPAEELIISLIEKGIFYYPNTVGLTIDYANKTTIRSQEAKGLEQGSNFNQYNIFNGRKRCNVADDGTINAFYGDADYIEDGSNGQVMVYQPKFYYCRIPLSLENNIIRKEMLVLSGEPHTGFKLHPLFINENGEELEYVLLSAYDGCAFDTSTNAYDLTDSTDINYTEDKLSSISGAKPISGLNKSLTNTNAEKLATNRGEGWHITNMAAESANQMLEIVEFGTLNGQEALELGIVDVPNTAQTNCASITGSTASLGNNTGVASSTISEANGNRTTYSINGRRAISYRGFENPWGNIWRHIGGTFVVGTGTGAGGTVYIYDDYDYTTNNYHQLTFNLPNNSDYTSAFGYDAEYDWVFIAAENNGNSSVPIGDKTWIIENLNGTKSAQFGGSWLSNTAAGIFHYDFDQKPDMSARTTGARLMYIPIINSIYEANLDKWQASMEEISE